jgi:hypothetical protein
MRPRQVLLLVALVAIGAGTNAVDIPQDVELGEYVHNWHLINAT